MLEYSYDRNRSQEQAGLTEGFVQVEWSCCIRLVMYLWLRCSDKCIETNGQMGKNRRHRIKLADFRTLDMPCLLTLRSTFVVSGIQIHLSPVPGGWCQPGGRPSILL